MEELLDLNQTIFEGKHRTLLKSPSCAYPFFAHKNIHNKIPSTSLVSEELECDRIMNKKLNSFPRWVDKEVEERHIINTRNRSSQQSFQSFKSNGDTFYNRCVDLNAFVSAGLTRYGLCTLQIMNGRNEAVLLLDQQWMEYFVSHKFMDKIPYQNKSYYLANEFPDVLAIVEATQDS